MRTAGTIFREYRKRQTMTLGQVGDVAGCSDTHVSDMEHDKRRPTPEMIAKLAPLFQANSDYLCLIFGHVPEDLREALLTPASADELRARIGGVLDTATAN